MSVTAGVDAPPRERRRILRPVFEVLRPMYRSVIGDPVREGRLRLDGLPSIERQLARVGLVALFGLLLSLLLGDAWRAGKLLFLNDIEGRASFVPQLLYPVTLVALTVAWILFLWGAAVASLPLRAGAAVLFVLLTSVVGRAPAVAVGGSLALRWGPTVARVGFYGVPALMLLYSLAALSPALLRRVRYPLLVLTSVAVALVFGANLWVYAGQAKASLPTYGPGILDNLVREAGTLILPLVYVSALAVIQFSYGVSEAAAVPAWRLPSLVARLLLAALLVVKLSIQLLPLGTWTDYVGSRPVAALRVLLSLALLLVAALLARRFANDRVAAEEANERLLYAGAFVLAIPFLLNVVAIQGASFLLSQFDWAPAASLPRWWPYGAIGDYGLPLLFAGLLVVGLYLLSRGRDVGVARETGLGLVLLGAWALPSMLLTLFDLRPGFRDSFFDLVITLAVAAYLVVRWRRVDGPSAVRLGAIVIFSWLVLTKADFLGILGGLAGLPAIFIVVVGVLWTLAADSSFASGDSRSFPRAARPLLWIGFLLLSATILNWTLATHVEDPTASEASLAFFMLGIPLAAWLLMRRPFVAPSEKSAPSG